MTNSNQYLITLLRQDYSREFFVPSLERPENRSHLPAKWFATHTLPETLEPNQWQLDFTSEPDEFGIIGVTCDVSTAAKIQDMPSVASVMKIHQSCISDAWDLLPLLTDENTQKAFAELRQERRFQKHFESAWSSAKRVSLRTLCGDLFAITPQGEHFNLKAIGDYLAMSISELSDFMILSPFRLNTVLSSTETRSNVVNRARALLLFAHLLRKIYGTSARATDWMQGSPTGWHKNGLSAKDCLLTGRLLSVWSHLTEKTRNPEHTLCGGRHKCLHDSYCTSRRC